MRTARLAAVTAAMLVGVVAGCAPADTDAGAANRGTTPATEATEPSSEHTAALEEETTPEAEPETTPEPEPELGTRENPAEVESDEAFFGVGDEKITVTLGAANWDATSVVLGENEYQDPPADGSVFVIVPVTVGYSGPDSVLPWIDLDVTFLADNGRSYEDTFAIIPDDLMDVADIYDGGTATGNVLFELPADQVPGGMWGVSYNWSDPLWWEAE